MRKTLGILLLIAGIAFIGLPLLTLIGGSCLSACSVSASAEEVFTTDNDVYDLYLPFPFAYYSTPQQSNAPIMVSPDIRVTIRSNLHNSGEGIKIDVHHFNGSHYLITNLGYAEDLQFPFLNVALGSGLIPFTLQLRNEYVNLPTEYTIDEISAVRVRTLNFTVYYDFISFEDTLVSAFSLRMPDTSATSSFVTRSFTSNNTESIYRISQLRYDLADYQSAFDEGYKEGLKATLDDVNPFNVVLNTADNFLKVSPFGNDVTFGYILSIGFGVLLLGLCIKIFLGG